MADKQTWERRIIESGYRELAKRCHPDKGGEPGDMAALNSAVANLRAVEQCNAAATVRVPPPAAAVAQPQGVYFPFPIIDGTTIFEFARGVAEILFGKPKAPKRRRRRAR